VVALTFDDGPNEIATPVILDVLADRGVAATFFVFGSRASAHPDLIARMIEAGHRVQPHCWAGHESHHELDKAALEDDLARTMGALEALGCPTPTIWRPPNGDIKDPQSYEVAAANRLRLVTWTLQTCDWSDAHSADRILRDIDSQTREDAVLRRDSVVLMHDTPKTPRLLAGLLDRIEGRGYQIGLLHPENPATARGGDYRFGRLDGKLPCGLWAP
jgi:peptidoglycan/xylan/chitin deacetylase (PgdA/CDA1 family)